MGAETKIQWCDRTFNPWLGCTKVSDGCKFCYAETLMDTRYGKVEWGPQGRRVRTSDHNWRQPVGWNRQRWFQCPNCGHRFHETRQWGQQQGCPACGFLAVYPTRQRVFCASLADVFEGVRPELPQWREDLFRLMEHTPNLDWLVLTKRVDLVWTMAPLRWMHQAWPQNVWLGTSVENQVTSDGRLVQLRLIPAPIRFVSFEPLLGPIETRGLLHAIHWAIIGGESGPHFRPMKHQWARSLIDQCNQFGVPVFMKQDAGIRSGMYDHLPDDMKIRRFPDAARPGESLSMQTPISGQETPGEVRT